MDPFLLTSICLAANLSQFRGSVGDAAPTGLQSSYLSLPMRPLVLLFISIPIVEMFLLIKVGSIIGAIPTIALVLFTAIVGLWLLKREGIATLHKVQVKLAQAEIPGQELLEGVMLLIGGALLLTPGFITDAIGFSCIMPVLRTPLAGWLIQKGLLAHIQLNSFHGTRVDDSTETGGSGRIIEGEFVVGDCKEDEPE